MFCRKLLGYVDLNIWYGGYFEVVDEIVHYVGGKVGVKHNFRLDKLTIDTLRSEVALKLKLEGTKLDNFSVWCKLKGMTLTNGRVKIVSEHELDILIKSVDKVGTITVWVIKEPIISPTSPKQRSKYVSRNESRRQHVIPGLQMMPDSVQATQQSCNSHVDPIPFNSENITPPLFRKSPTLTLPPQSPSMVSPRLTSPSQNPIRRSLRFASPSLTPHIESRPNTLTPTSPLKSLSPKHHGKRVKSVARKSTNKIAENKGNKGLTTRGLIDAEFSESSDSELSDIDIEFRPEEEDHFGKDVEEELLAAAHAKSQSDEGKGKRAGKGKVKKKVKGKVKEKVNQVHDGMFVNDNDIILRDEGHNDSDSDLRSIHGSDDDVDPYPTFNPEVDFKKKINLTIGLKFAHINDLRKAVRLHAIQNTYDYYFLHNTPSRFSVYCKHKCNCEWDIKHARILNCTCSLEVKCPFKLYAVRLPREQTIQIKSVILEHTCGQVDVNSKVTAEWLFENYHEYFRDDHGERLKKFIARVFSDTGVTIGYHKAWMARSRAKLQIYGDASDQYKLVYDYAHAIMKYNPGSSAIVSVVRVEDSPPVFQRFYVCLEACKSGFKAGCRPLIGVDGCHLKRPYPGVILTDVAKDGNNCIFPIAWAIVEVEDKYSWRWFLELLMDDIGHPMRNNLTLMSDRQKGLVDALETVCPNAELRFCVRHIWANFKLQFSGTAYKEAFWRAARTSSRSIFLGEMEAIKFLSVDAFAYLDAIPPKFWSRHAFQSHSKSNMLLNNLCETFNAVRRDARDKPIITCLETSPKCRMMQSRLGECEVEYNYDRFVVDLNGRTCIYYKWDLTGIPCVHAYACILKRRGVPYEYVHNDYSKDMYLKTCELYIKAMLGMKQWEQTDFEKPLPPPIRKMPGRPSHKKRKKEVGEKEGMQNQYVRRPKRQNQCGNCGKLGNYRTKCNNPPAPPKDKGKCGQPPSIDPWKVSQREKKEARISKKKFNEFIVSNPSILQDIYGPSSAVKKSTKQGKQKQQQQHNQSISATQHQHVSHSTKNSLNNSQASKGGNNTKAQVNSKKGKKISTS